MMSTQKSSRRTGLKYLIAAVVVLVVSMWFVSIKPIWLAPPLLVYTPLVYVLLAYAWLPLLYLAVYHFLQKMGPALLLVMVLMCGQWFCWASVVSQQQIIEMTGDTSAFTQRHCQYPSPEIYLCEVKVGSSDSPEVQVLTQTFRVWGGVPIAWLIASDFRLE